MRKESEIKADLKQLIDANHANAGKLTGDDQRALNKAVRSLRQELSDLYSDGANPCPKCGTAPIGMDRATKFEVGCVVCPPFLISPATRVSYSAQGRSPAEAVDNWNSERFLEDNKIDLVPMPAG